MLLLKLYYFMLNGILYKRYMTPSVIRSCTATENDVVPPRSAPRDADGVYMRKSKQTFLPHPFRINLVITLFHSTQQPRSIHSHTILTKSNHVFYCGSCKFLAAPSVWDLGLTIVIKLCLGKEYQPSDDREGSERLL